MKKPFITHLFTKIIEGQNEKALSASAAKATLEHIESVGEQIRESQGEGARQSVLNFNEVKRALEQCIDFSENSKSTVTEEDHTIYYDFLHAKLTYAEKVINSELSELGL
jgi:hypothetical protein